MKRILKEPLLHFLVLGAAIFAVYGLVSRRAVAEPGRIIVSQGQITAMAVGFARTWQRPPTREELAELIQDKVKEEVYCREAMALGLDKDDAVIRRRLRQKLEFVSDDVAAQAEPNDADLGAYLQAHPEAFRVEPRYTFSQVYLDPDKHGDHLAGDVAQALAKLRQAGSTADGSALGDPFLLERTFSSVPAGDVVKQFGDKFAAALAGLPPGTWQGPVESGFGVHLVLVGERVDGRLPALAEVRDAVRREWANAQRLEMNRRFYQELLKRYAVTIEEPEPVKGEPRPAAAK